MIKKLQFYVSESLSPYINLAKEKFLFDTVDSDTLILYLWQNQNTVVIGKNQNIFSECRTELLSKEGGTVARRLSGGGAVFHDIGNLNFTFICKSENLDTSKHMQVIQGACRIAGIATELSGRNDILADGRKFSGNAFYNSKGTSYHHGTILISADKEKMTRYLTPPKAKLESKGVKSVRSRVINLTEINPLLTCRDMKSHLLLAFEEVYGLKPTEIEDIDEARISVLAEHYGRYEYLYENSFPFDFVCKGRLSFGSVEIQMQIKKGAVAALRCYTDALDSELPRKLESALVSCQFEPQELRKALAKTLSDTEATELYTLLEDQILS